ncbi:MAG: hypothetical protein F4Y55_14020 [Gammaproteobacteria bacterium]|nr:hypothetical protein [Gammaproteobacteria bacterium]
MNERDYSDFVGRTDKANNLDVALYGIAGEVGSVVSAVKRRLIGNDETNWNVPNKEIIEELGDLLWYCFAFARCHCTAEGKPPLNILKHDIANLKEEIDNDDERARGIGDALVPEKRATFLRRAAEIEESESGMELDDYQTVAYLTARTKGRLLLEVCLAVLSQLCAELFRVKMPEIELSLNQNIADRSVPDVLGEMAWHIAAMTSLYGRTLEEVAEANMKKVSKRFREGEPTGLYDEGFPESERFPRQMEICFVSVSETRLQMYYDGKRLGDPLTDNAPEDDGYRYHDILHLAFVAKLGWSPVLRGLLGRKRKSDPKVDEAQDGARAKIIEEAVLNAIHAEGARQARLRASGETSGPDRFFATPSEISFDLLRLVENFVRDLEVRDSNYWEWESAIHEGFNMFHKLRAERQGTIKLDLNKRSIDFRPTFHVGLRGEVAALGSAVNVSGRCESMSRKQLIKSAVLNALGIGGSSIEALGDIEIDENTEAGVAVRARGHVREAMWDQGIVEFRITVSEQAGEPVFCAAIGIGDGS